MKLKDIYGNIITIQQAKSGAIIISFGNFALVLSKEQTLNFSSLYEIEDSDIECFNEYYNLRNQNEKV